MASSTQHTMETVERRRLQLEEDVAKLRKALEHWSAWETEYEMLKEELQKAGSPSSSQMLEIGRDLGGTMVNEKEVEELLGKDLQTKRTANQVVDMISRRIDYVQQNRSTVEKQFDAAEKRLAGVSLLSDPGLENEEGLPIMDIEEELDDDENVISSSVSQPGKVAPELMEVLRKAGLQKSELDTTPDGAQKASKPTSTAPPSVSTSASRSASAPAKSVSSTTKNATPASTNSKPKAEPKPKASEAAPKKSVSFAEDINVKTYEKPTSFKEDLKNWNLKPGSKVYEFDSDDNIVAKHVVPGDSPDDAQLRREMLQYGLSEVGNVVAELDVEDNTDMEDDFDEEDDSDESEEEDEYGRSTRPYLTDDYREQMMELEKKLNARMVENIGPRPDLHPLADNVDDVRTLRVRRDAEFDESIDSTKDAPIDSSQMQSVRFAEGLDTSNAPGSTQGVSSAKPTISETIVERSAPAAPQPPGVPIKPGKVSRFKSARAGNQPPVMLPTPPTPAPPPVPTGPAGRTLATTVVEHTQQPSDPQAPDEFDSVILNREISTEYHKMRNRMIQQQGGFIATEEDKEDPIMEERDGKTKKVSRFKAARLKAEGL